MKTKPYLCIIGIIICTVSIFLFSTKTEVYVKENEQLLMTVPSEERLVEITENIDPIVYDGLTKSELIEKINRSLNSTVSNKGELIVTQSLEKGVDPYMATAIMLHETGCKWNCSTLVKKCNNVGGQVGKPSCNGGSYMSYNTLDEGIKGFINNLSVNYINKGLTTVEQIGSKYAASTSWGSKVNKYIEEIKSK